MTATTSSTEGLGAAALAYAAAGLRVFPVARSRRPLTTHGKNDATTDPETIAAWWRTWPLANIGALTGRVAGFFVLDVDPRNGGDASLAALQAQHGPLPSTLTCRTSRGGVHLYFAHPGGAVKTDTSGKVGPGLDILGERASVTLPPSRHRSGVLYAWIDASVPIAAPPAWLVALVRPVPRVVRSALAVVPVSSSRYGARALAAEAATVRAAPEGRRNRQLNASSFSLGQLVGAGLLAQDAVVAALLDAALASGLPEAEARGTIASGLKGGKAEPRRVERRR